MLIRNVLIILVFLFYIISCKKEEASFRTNNNDSLVIDISFWTFYDDIYEIDLNGDEILDITVEINSFLAASGYSDIECNIILKDSVQLAVVDYINAVCKETLIGQPNNYEPDTFTYYRTYQCSPNNTQLYYLDTLEMAKLMEWNNLMLSNHVFSENNPIPFHISFHSCSPIPTAGSTCSNRYMSSFSQKNDGYFLFKVKGKKVALHISNDDPTPVINFISTFNID